MGMLRAGLAVMVTVAAACSTASVVGSTAGSINVGVRVSGEAVDTAFSMFINADTTAYALTTGATRSFSAEQGTHQLYLKGVAGNCVVSGANPRSVVVGALEVVSVTFDVACTNNGDVKVTIATTGEDQDDMYTLAFDNDFRTFLVGPSQFVIVSLPVKTYSVALRDVASNCSVASPNPVTVAVTKGAMVETGFQVACRKR
jgi:hypothetical protein